MGRIQYYYSENGSSHTKPGNAPASDDVTVLQPRVSHMNTAGGTYYNSIKKAKAAPPRNSEQSRVTVAGYTVSAPIPCATANFVREGTSVRCESFNDSLCQLLGYQQDTLRSLLQDPAFPLFHPDDHSAIVAVWDALTTLGTAYSLSCRLKVCDGTDLPVQLTVSQFTDQDAIPHYQWVFMALTDLEKRERKKLEYQTQCLNKMDEALFGGTVISRLNVDAPLLYVSSNMEKLLGYSVAEFKMLRQTQPECLLHPDDLPKVIARVKQYTVERPMHYEMEFRFLRKNGSVFWVMERATFLPDIQGQPAYLSIFVDISGQKRKLEKLRMEKEAYRFAAVHTQSFVYYYDIATGKATRPSDADSFYGLPQMIENMPETLLQDQIVAPESTEKVLQFFRDLSNGVVGGTVELRCCFFGEEYHWFRGEYSLLRTDPKAPISAILVFTLIDDQRQRDQERSALLKNKQIMQILEKHAQKYLVTYHFATDTITPYSSEVNILKNELPLYASPKDYFTQEVIAPECVSDMLACYNDLKDGKPENLVYFRARALDGTLKWFKCTISTVFSNQQKPLYAIASFEEVTDAYERDIAFQRYQNLISATDPGMLFYLDYNLTHDTLEWHSESMQKKNCKWPRFSDAAHKGFMACMQEIEHHYIDPLDREKFHAMFTKEHLLARFAQGMRKDALDIRIHPDSVCPPIYIRASYHLISDPYTSDIRLMFSCKIIDKEKRAHLELLNRAQFDAVTGIFNRATFEKLVQQQLNQLDGTLVYAFIVMDVDHFKEVNDTLGHLSGDQVLRDIAVTPRSFLRKTDLIGRIGGDEFGLFLGDFPKITVLQEKLERLKSAIAREIGDSVRVSASFGISLFPKDGTTFETLYRKADLALYHCKEHGRDQYIFFDDTMLH